MTINYIAEAKIKIANAKNLMRRLCDVRPHEYPSYLYITTQSWLDLNNFMALAVESPAHIEWYREVSKAHAGIGVWLGVIEQSRQS